MKEILIFAGTTEGRALSEALTDAGIAHTVCVATEYGEIVLKENPLASIHRGRMDQEEIRHFVEKGNFLAVVDATHPYATVVTQNIKAAMKDLSIPYLRLKREREEGRIEGVRYFEDHEACAEALCQTVGNILLTTGSKDLFRYCAHEKLKERLYVRVLPGIESIQLCMEQGIAGKQILALQGPFTEQMNEAMLRQYDIQCLVTKQSGRTGGFLEKLKAAERINIPVYVVGTMAEEEGDSFEEVVTKLEKLSGKPIRKEIRFEITLAGVGMGNPKSLTVEVKEAIEHADVLLGAERMIAPYEPRIEKKPYYMAKQILPYLKELSKKEYDRNPCRVVILFSGDTGFYSGCKAMYEALTTEIEKGVLQADVSIRPGISSIACLASCIGERYEDALLVSMHGKEVPDLAQKIRANEKVFLLLSGASDLQALGELLIREGLTDCIVTAGYQLSYPEQEIRTLTPQECQSSHKEGLYTCLIFNPAPDKAILTPYRGDEAFIRDKVPMTKAEIREISICKLQLSEGAVVYDVGSGTGSVAVEMAGLSGSIAVYAIEQKEEAVFLIGRNKEQFGLPNLHVVKGKAPEALETLPVPTHAFIGGSSGQLREILDCLYKKNPQMRIVLNAISLETISELKEILTQFRVTEEEVVQVQVNRMKPVDSYHLMQAENPVWICSFRFWKEGEVYEA